MLCLLPLPPNSSLLFSFLPNHSHPQMEKEEFIDIEVCPNSKTSSPQSKEFEFQMSSCSNEKEGSTPSPADELFYKGKLLPLHLPPRLQMVEKLLENSIPPSFEASRSFTTAPPSSSDTPLESCRVSCELNPDEYFFQWSTEVNAFLDGGGNSHNALHSRKTWSKRVRLIKQCSLTQKLKSSRAYLKSLFMKPTCSDEEAWNLSKAKEYVSKYMKLMKRNPLGEMENERHQVSSFTMKSMLDEEMEDQTSFTCHRKSFSGAIKRHCTSKCYSSTTSATSSSCSSSSSSFSLKSSDGFYEINLLKRSISAKSEVESSVEGAIAHCKKSQGEVRACLVKRKEEPIMR